MVAWSLLFVFVRISDGSGKGKMIFFFIFSGDDVSGDNGDTGRSILFDDRVLLAGDVLRNIGDKFESLLAFDAANKRDSYFLYTYAEYQRKTMYTTD